MRSVSSRTSHSTGKRAATCWLNRATTSSWRARPKTRAVTLPFDYLDPGKEYVATLYADAPDADYQTNPQAYVIRTGKVGQRTELDVEMARGGGFAISIREATDADRKLCKLK